MSAPCPRLSLVTPTFNSEAFLADTLASVVSQNVIGLEHVVVDGGSTDGTLGILDRFRPHLAKIMTGPDSGQYDAINKGFASTSGEVMAWLNSDDVYLPAMLNLVLSLFERFPAIQWLTTSKPMTIAATGEVIGLSNVLGFSKEGFLQGENLPGQGWPATVFIQQESTFWRRDLWDKAGGRIDLTYGLAGDYHLWARFFDHAELHTLDVPISCFRRHKTQRSAVDFEGYLAEAKNILEERGGRPRKSLRRKLSILSRTPGWQNFRRSLIKAKVIRGLPVIKYDWGTDDWFITAG